MTSDHIANHYTLLAHAYATTNASSSTHVQVSSRAPPTECSLAVTLPSAQLLHKGGATTHLKGSIKNVKVYSGSLKTLQADGQPGKSTFNQNLASSHLTKLSQ